MKQAVSICALLFWLSLSFSCRSAAPEIHSITPKIGMMGETVILTGAHFGTARGESHVTVAAAAPTSSQYQVWQDNLISFTVPELGEAGMVYVHVRGKKSNGVLFSNTANLPQPIADDRQGLEPRIVSITPGTGAIGSLITIAGFNFGNSHQRGGLFFSWNAEPRSPIPAAAAEAEFIEVSETEFGYELWNEREIRVRVPDGAASGTLEVRTPRGASSPFLFDVTGKPGTKTFRDKRSYTISYSVNIQTSTAEIPNTLYLWIPQPAASPAQRNIELLSRSAEPFVENYRGVSLYKLSNLSPNSGVHISLSYKIDVYAIETALRSYAVRAGEDTALYSMYTKGDTLLPVDDPRIKNRVGELLGRERNSEAKARRLYEWLIGGGMIQETAPEGSAVNAVALNAGALEAGALEALEKKKADPYMAVLLYCTMLRAAGVPCLPVAGVLINRNRQTIRHYWAEFWIDGLGWIPVDPVMGAGAVPEAFRFRSDRASYYFGSIDNQRIAFSRGVSGLSQMDPRGRPVTHNRSYALQTVWEEAAGGIESYSSLWGDVIIGGVYVQ